MSKNDTTSPDLLSAVLKLMKVYDRIERDDLPDGFAKLIDDVYAAATRLQKTVEQIERGSYAEFASDVTKMLQLHRTNSGTDPCFIQRSVLWDVEALLATAIEDASDNHVLAAEHPSTDDAAYWQEQLESLKDTQAAVQGALRRAK